MDKSKRLCIGIDTVSIKRVGRASRHPRFLERVFTGNEIEYLSGSCAPHVLYARYFAAKEAAAKALGTGFWRGFAFTDIEVVCNGSGRGSERGQSLRFYNGAAEALGQRKAFLSSSFSGDLAVARVLIE